MSFERMINLPKNNLYRSVRMENGFAEVENCLATLLVHVKIETKATDLEKYNSKSEMQVIKKNYQDLLELQKEKKNSKTMSLILLFISKGFILRFGKIKSLA